MVLWGYHGVSSLEAKCGTEFKIDMTLSLIEKEEYSVLTDTVDYVKVHEMVKEEFDRPEMLLESLVKRICDSVMQRFPEQIARIQITILKIGAPILGFSGQVGVSFDTKNSTTSI